jgi:hypothetical protein
MQTTDEVETEQVHADEHLSVDDGEDYDDVTADVPVVVPYEALRLADEPKPEDRKRLLRRFSADGLDLRNTWQIAAGAILLPLGVAVILLGWSGAAHGRVDQQQIPYLISGGVLGLATVIIGGFFFWAHWLYRIYDQADLHHQEAMREQAELVRALLEAVGRAPRANGSDGGEAAGSGAYTGNGSAAELVATPTGTNFHTPGCPIIANRSGSVRSVTAEEAADMRPCRICEPEI